MDKNRLDLIDIGTFIIAIAVTASAYDKIHSVVPALPIFFVWFVFNYGRRSKMWHDFVDSKVSDHPIGNKVAPLLLPPAPSKPLELVSPKVTQEARWIDRITQPLPTVQEVMKAQAMQSEDTTMEHVLAMMPKRIMYNHPKVPNPPNPTSVLIGYDPVGKKWVWADFGKKGDTIHAFVGGQTRAGKDSELRLWFTQLTSQNTPEDLKFIILDGKGEWKIPALQDAKHMLMPPIGGMDVYLDKGKLVDRANEELSQGVIDTFHILQQRAQLFQKTGALNLTSYEQKTGNKLPLIVVIATDIKTNLIGNFETLIQMLLLKGGSLGIRAIISMQSASGEDTGWRGQTGLCMSGYQGQASADAPNLGIPVRAMKYRPSQLPSVDVPENRGLFVVRKGISQYIVRGVYLPDDVFINYCENILPNKNTMPKLTNNDLLAGLLTEAPKPVIVKARKDILTKEQIETVVALTRKGISRTDILRAIGKTRDPYYSEAAPIVDALIKTVKVHDSRRVHA